MKHLKENRIYSFDEIYVIAERLIEMEIVSNLEKGDYIALLVKEDSDSTWEVFEATGSYGDAYGLTDSGVGPDGRSMVARIKTNKDLEENENKIDAIYELKDHLKKYFSGVVVTDWWYALKNYIDNEENKNKIPVQVPRPIKKNKNKGIFDKFQDFFNKDDDEDN